MENTNKINNIYDFPVDPYCNGEEIFLWGVKSSDDMSSCEACFNTMNDLVITYNEFTKQYSVGVETIYFFENKTDSCSYINYLLSEFTNWMNTNNYNTDEHLTLGDVFHWQYNQFPTVSKAYAWFKLMVEAYVEKYK